VRVTLVLVAPHKVAETPVVPSTPETVVPLPAEIEGRIVVFDIFQVTSSVTVWVPVTPLKIAVATKVAELPLVIVALVPPLTVTVSCCTTGHTVTVMVELVIAPSEALIVVVPGGFGMFVSGPATSWPTTLGLKLATDSSEELQVDLPVTSFVLPSLKVPVAVIC